MEKTEKARYIIISYPAVGIGVAEAMRDKLTVFERIG